MHFFAKASDHQYPQRWPNSYYIEPIKKKYIDNEHYKIESD